MVRELSWHRPPQFACRGVTSHVLALENFGRYNDAGGGTISPVVLWYNRVIETTFEFVIGNATGRCVHFVVAIRDYECLHPVTQIKVRLSCPVLENFISFSRSTIWFVVVYVETGALRGQQNSHEL